MLRNIVSRLFSRQATDAVKPPKRKLSQPLYKPLVWIDCEMTGLDISKDHIIEICCIITDGHLNVIDPVGYESTVYVSKKVLDNMNEWCVNQHGLLGLTAKVLANPQQTLAKVQAELLEYIQSYVPEPNTSLLAGNSVHMDKFFMMKEFPQVIEHLHYRLVDVSSIMEVGFRHNPELMKKYPKKKGAHTAKSDIMESIAQLKWYRDNYLRSDVPASTGPADEPPQKKQRLATDDSAEPSVDTPTADPADSTPAPASGVEVDEIEVIDLEPEQPIEADFISETDKKAN